MTSLAVIGLGYVGLPLAVEAVRSGLSVAGIDSSPVVTEGLMAGRSHVDDVPDEVIAEIAERGFRATTDPAPIAEADVVLICVPTPLSADGGPDLSAVIGAAEQVAAHLRPGQLVVLESTSYPGTTEEVVLPILQASGLRVGADFNLAFSPERIDPGNGTFGLRNTPKVVGGVTPACAHAVEAFYRLLVNDVVMARGTREAEMTKLLENTYRHINIAMVNEMAQFCHELGIDLWDSIRCASTKPFGFQPFSPGPGVGGHCIPIDPNYLDFRVRTNLGRPFRLVEVAQEINAGMPAYIVRRGQDLLNGARKATRDSRVLLLGVTYKPDIADQRETPALPIALGFQTLGADVRYHDPFVPCWCVGGQDLVSEPDLGSAVAEADLVVLIQAHSGYDVGLLAAAARLLLDTRGVTAPGTADRL